MISRRGFLSAFGLGAAAFVLDPEMLLWKPGAKTIFLPAVEAFTGFNTFITPSWITQDIAKFWTNSLTLRGSIGGHVWPDRDTWRAEIAHSVGAPNLPRLRDCDYAR